MPEKQEKNGQLNRRQLLQAAAAAGVMLSLPETGRCSSLPSMNRIQADDGKALILTNANIVDVAAGEVLFSRVIVIRRGVIEAVSDRMPHPQEGQVVYDLKNGYVIPGLIDAHCHMTLTSEAGFHLCSVLTTYSQMERNYAQQLMQGVTTVRDMGAMPKALSDALEKIENNEMPGPRVVYCNAFTNLYGGHPDINPRDISVFAGMVMALTGDPYMYFRNTRELKERMPQNIAGGASFIKVTMDNRSLMCGRGSIPFYSDEHLRVIMEFAQSHNMPVAGHVHTKFGFDRSMQFGLHSLEHMVGDAGFSDQEVLEMAQKKTAIVPTMIIAQMFSAQEAYKDLPVAYRTDFILNEMAIRRRYLKACTSGDVEPDIHQANLATLSSFRKYGCANLYDNGVFLPRPDLYFNILLYGPANLLKMKQAGVLIGCGTDSGVTFMYHGALWREMEMLGRIGFSNQEVLQCATLHNARILRMDDKIGSIEKGKYADMAVLAGNPLERLETLRKPALVVKDGCIYTPGEEA